MHPINQSKTQCSTVTKSIILHNLQILIII